MTETISNKQWKRVPFDIELAKKIQSGEVEGRIVTNEDLLVRIVDFNFKDKTDSIVYIGTYANGEQEFIQTCNNEGKSFGADVLFIELPEEAPKHKYIYEFDENPKKLLRTEKIEQVAAKITVDGFVIKNRYGEHDYGNPKHEFKPFDKVLVRYPDKTELCAPNSAWLPGIFQYKSVNSNLYFVSGKAYKDCIPYEGNEHLVGTTNNPE